MQGRQFPKLMMHSRNRNRNLIVNSRFLVRPQKRSRRIQLIRKIKSIGSGQDPESQAGRQSDGYGGWCLELRRGGRYEEDDKSRYLPYFRFPLFSEYFRVSENVPNFSQ